MTNKSYWFVSINTNNKEFNSDHLFSDRFLNDKCFYEDENYLLISDGILLNKKDLIGCESTMKELLFCALSHKTDIASWNGPMTGFVFDKRKEYGFAWGNQTGDASCFYSFNETNNQIYISNNFNVLSKFVGCDVLDEKTAHYLITYGYVPDDGTISTNIKRLEPGRMLRIENNGIKIVQYHRFSWSDADASHMTVEQAVEGVDYYFRKAIQLCFEKDKEYGYSHHLADLSAGLDSRMVNWVAKQLGYENITNISYSQSQTNEYRFAAHLGGGTSSTFFSSFIG